METVNVPSEKASEPDEGARQPLDETMTPKLVGQPTKKVISFAEDTMDTEKPPSPKSRFAASKICRLRLQPTPPAGKPATTLASSRKIHSIIHSAYKEALSQPASNLSHRQKLLWLQKRRTAGLWVQCDDCDRWRFLENVLDSYELPKKWFCRMNPDLANADCSVPETPIRVSEEEDLIHSEYSAGSLVWAQISGWPWWPAMVNDCPDTEQFYWLDGYSDIPTHYNVVFFDSADVTRAWISPEHLKPYAQYKNTFKPFLKNKRFQTRLRAAVNQADDALKLPLFERLDKYSFLARYKGIVSAPKKVNKKDLKKHQKSLKRRFNIEFDASNSDEDEEVLPIRSPSKSQGKNNNVIVLGTPKKPRTRASRVAKDRDNVLETRTVSEKPLGHAPEAILQDGVTVLEISDTVMENIETALANMETGKTGTTVTYVSTNDAFKQPNSLAVQAGSTVESATVEEPFDNDTSKTYIPEKETQESTQSTQNNTVSSGITDFQVRIASPSSEDFDF